MNQPSTFILPENASQDAAGKIRIIQELVPGKQITLAHIIASPDPILYQKLGLDPTVDWLGAAIGMITLSPAETAIIAADIATKESGAQIGFVDRFSGTLLITGTISDVEAAFRAALSYCEEKLGFSVCPLTKT
ncbi:MAG: BMC domain-containing protein [Clostridia bacterium]|nr:BMC domain-containing protein [Clostridia bacterium]